MRIRHRITYHKDLITNEFIDFLNRNNIKPDKTNSYIGVVYIYEKDEYMKELKDLIKKDKLGHMIDVVYTKSELEKSEWLYIHPSFRFEYPQPEGYSEYRNITYDNTNWCESCGSGLFQIDSFRVKKAPKWSKRNFLMLNWIEDELFISSKAKECLESSGMTGFKIFNVINHKKNTVFDDFFQIYVENQLEPGLVNHEQSVREQLNCDKCGSVKYIGTGLQMSFKKEIFENLNFDIVKTYEKFGAGHLCASVILISQRLYQIIKQNDLDSFLSIEPVSLI